MNVFGCNLCREDILKPNIGQTHFSVDDCLFHAGPIYERVVIFSQTILACIFMINSRMEIEFAKTSEFRRDRELNAAGMRVAKFVACRECLNYAVQRLSAPLCVRCHSIINRLTFLSR